MEPLGHGAIRSVHLGNLREHVAFPVRSALVRARFRLPMASSRRHGTRPCLRDATLVVWSPDYDGKGKAWVRFDDGTDAIVGGSRVER